MALRDIDAVLPAQVGQALADDVLGIAVAAGVGLLIGIERERRKGVGEDREAAGLRTFVVAALTGALTQTLPVPGLVLAGAILIVVLAGLSYARSRSDDPGLTTELALFTTYLIGVQAVLSPALGAAFGAGLALLLAARERLHRFATSWLRESELHDALLLAALALILLPLVPSRSIEWLAGMNPRPLASLVLLILAIQAGGHMALRALGPRTGALAGGLLAGFVSSTACVATQGRRARETPRRGVTLAAGAGASGAATWIQALLMSGALAPSAALAFVPAALSGSATALLGAWLLARTDRSAGSDAEGPGEGSALRLREALSVAVLLAVVALVVGSAGHRFGEAGVWASVAITALADAHAPVASLAAMRAGDGISLPQFAAGALLAIGSNTLMRCAVAAASGGTAYALRITAVMLASFMVAVLVALATVLQP